MTPRRTVGRSGPGRGPGASRRSFLATVAGGTLLGLAPGTALGGSTGDGDGGGDSREPSPQALSPEPGPVVGVERVAGGLTAPVALETATESADRRFVVDQTGEIRVLGPDGPASEPFLDVSDRLVALRSGFDERGLLGLAFHPDFATNRRFFLRYSAPPDDDTPAGYDHRFVLSEFTATADGTAGDPASERVLLELPEPQFNHNAGPIAFGPDGYLYVAVGDGGGANDAGTGHVADWYDANDGGNGQDVTGNLLGAILRIDVDGGDPYAIPADNPLVGEEGLDEHWAWGFRNPWGMSFDAQGRLFVADVGQNAFEEVNLVEKGGNYGWNVREGTHCFSTDTPSEPPGSCPTETTVRGGEPLLAPIVEYPHTADGERVGTAVVGGFVDEAGVVPALQGAYVFGDWSRSSTVPDGRLFAARPANGGLWSVEELRVAGVGNGRLDRYVRGFGRDDGDLYVLTAARAGPSGTTGEVYRLTEPTANAVELDGETSGWVGRAPASIDGETNPALRLVPGELYEFRWTNVDGAPHQFQLLDGEGTVLAETEAASTTGATRSVRLLADRATTAYRCSFHPGSMRGEVSTGPPPVVGDRAPADPDGDGLYEDVNGDGSTNVIDVAVLLDEFEGSTVRSEVDAFDFTGDGRIDILDVAELLREV